MQQTPTQQSRCWVEQQKDFMCVQVQPSCVYRHWRQPAVDKAAMFILFFFLSNVINFCNNTSPGLLLLLLLQPHSENQPLTLSPGPSAPPAWSNTYSFRRRQHSWQGLTTTHFYFFPASKQSCHLSIQTEVCSFTGVVWHHNILSVSAASALDINNTCKSTLWQQYAFLITQL